MQNRRQLIKSAGALAPSLILPAGILTTSNAHADMPQLVVEKLRSMYPGVIRHTRHFPETDGVGKMISGQKAGTSANRISKEEWVLERTSGPIWPSSKFIDYKVEQKISYDSGPNSGKTYTRTYHKIRNRLNALDKNDMYTEALKINGDPNYFPKSPGADRSVRMNTYQLYGKRTEETCADRDRCLISDRFKARMFALTVPLMFYDIPEGFTQLAGTGVVASSGLISWYFGYREFEGTYNLTGERGRFAMWYAWDAIQHIWRWTVVRSTKGAQGITFQSTLVAQAGSAFSSYARLATLAAVTGSAYYSTLVARGMQASTTMFYANDSYDADDAWATGVLALTLVSAGVSGTLIMNEMRHIREKMGVAAGRIKSAGSNFENFHVASGVLSAANGNYLDTGSQSAADVENPPIFYNAADVAALRDMMDNLVG